MTSILSISEVIDLKRKSALLLAMIVGLALLPAASAQATGSGSLEATTTHVNVVEPVFENDRYLLAWQGQISGDVNGYIEWWIDTQNWTAWPDILNPDLPPKPVSQYVEIVRIYDVKGGTLLLETLERGETTLATMSWWANGKVTYADPQFFPGWEGQGVQESGMFDVSTVPWTGTSTFRLVAEPLVTGFVLVDAATNLDIGPLDAGTVINLGTTPEFNIRAEAAPEIVGSVGFAVVDSENQPVRFRLDGQPRENFAPFAVGGDWPVGDYLPMTLGPGTYTVTATAYSGGSLTGTRGPSLAVTFTVAEPFTTSYTGAVLGINTKPADIAARCTGPSWAVVSFGGPGEQADIGSFDGYAEHCSYVGLLPDGTVGPDGTYGEGIFTLTADDGGEVLKGTYTDGQTIAPPPDVEFVDVWSFDGGTGRFATAIGEGIETGTVDFSAGFVPGAPFAVTMTGWIVL
jgi:hypothetical protein